MLHCSAVNVCDHLKANCNKSYFGTLTGLVRQGVGLIFSRQSIVNEGDVTALIGWVFAICLLAFTECRSSLR